MGKFDFSAMSLREKVCRGELPKALSRGLDEGRK